MGYWVYQDSRILGPYTSQELASVPGLTGETLVCHESATGVQENDWRAMASVPELASLFADKLIPLAAAVEGGGKEGSGDWGGGLETEALGPSPADKALEADTYALLEAERLRIFELEEMVSGLKAQLREHELKQDEILERLGEKDRMLAEKETEAQALKTRVEEAESRLLAQEAAAVAAAAAAKEAAKAAAEAAVAEAAAKEAAAREAAAMEEAAGKDAAAGAMGIQALPHDETVILDEQPLSAPSGHKEFLGELDALLPDATPLTPDAPSEPAVPESYAAMEPSAAEGAPTQPMEAYPAEEPAAEAAPFEEVETVRLEPEPEPFTPFAAPKAVPLDLAPAEPADTMPSEPVDVQPTEPLPASTFAPVSAPQPAAAQPPAEKDPPPFATLDLPGSTPPPAPAAEQPTLPHTVIQGLGIRTTSNLGMHTPAPAVPGFEDLMSAQAAERAKRATSTARPAAAVPAEGRARRQKGFLMILGVSAACVAVLWFLFFRNPKQVAQMVSMDPKGVPAGQAAASGEENPAATGFGVPAEPRGGTQAVQPRDFIEDRRIKALEFVKDYYLGKERGTIAQWLQFSFLTPGNEESWAAGAVEADVYVVSYRVFKVGRTDRGAESIVYHFEVDLTRGTLTGRNQAAKDLLAGGSTMAPRRQPSRPKTAARPRPEPARSKPETIRPKAQAPRRPARARSNGQMNLPGDDELEQRATKKGFTYSGPEALELNP